MDERVGIPRNPPVKPKRGGANMHSLPNDMDDMYAESEYSSAPSPPQRRGRNHSMRQIDSPPSSPKYQSGLPANVRNGKVSIVDQEPETTIGAHVKMKGELSFDRLLRIEGEFEGRLNSKGSLVIGPKGVLTGPVENMKEVYLAGGRIVGNIVVERIILRDKAQIFGNVTAKSIKVDPDCVVIGQLNVNPQAPEKINERGEIVKDDTGGGEAAA